jgi:hypothetical protein
MYVIRLLKFHNTEQSVTEQSVTEQSVTRFQICRPYTSHDARNQTCIKSIEILGKNLSVVILEQVTG